MNNLILASSTPKKNNTQQPKRKRHPTTQVMVDEALSVINRGKCSYRAITTYISTTYDVNMKFLTRYIKSYIRSSLENGKFIQMTGHGLNGSFRLSAAAKKNPEKFLSKPPRLRWKALFAAQKALKSINKPTTFSIASFHRRTSITKLTVSQRRNSGRIARARMAKIGIKYSIDSDSQSEDSQSEAEDENKSNPSTSAHALLNITFSKKKHV